jgi:2-dehydro-3-deoxy-D-arabinonate dehydratase
MRICRFEPKRGEIRVGLLSNTSWLLDLYPAGIAELEPLLENEESLERLRRLDQSALPRFPLSEVRLCAPVERQEIWAAGVTYLRSKTARMEESDFSANAYDRVYDADRPELFFKSMAEKVVPSGEPVGIRRDSKWSVPEPELALVMNSRGRIVGYTIGNDMSARDIEGANLLYLPQAKIYRGSCALGPCITLGTSETTARQWTIRLEIRRHGQQVFAGETSVAKIKRTFEELAGFLFRSQVLPYGAVLLTGTGVVPPDSFCLQEHDQIGIEVTGIGLLENPVMLV